ncbi:MAG: class I SAM-dependent methyltransferase [Candidatus Aminicenantes bacterium]
MSLKKNTFQPHEVREYERKRYRSWDQKWVDRRERRIIRRLLEQAGGGSGLILDVPCGYGRFSGLLRMKSEELVSSDISHAMVERALANRRYAGEERTLGVTGDILEGMPFRDGAFQGILSMRLFHHIHQDGERSRVLREYARVTTHWVICSYYQKNRLHQWQRRVRRKIKKSATRIHMVTPQEFARICRAADFEVAAAVPLFKGGHAQHIALLLKA